MSQFRTDLSFHYRGIKGRSKTIKEIERTARDRGMQHAQSLSEDLFNALYQKKPELKRMTDPNNTYSQVIRSVINSPSFEKIRVQTQGNLQWSAVGANFLLNEVMQQINFQEEPEPESQESDEETPSPQDNEEQEQEDSTKAESEDDSESDEDNESESEEENESQGEGESDEGSDEDEDSDDSGSNESESDNDEDGEDTESDSEGDSSDESESEDDNDAESGTGSSESDEESDDSTESFGGLGSSEDDNSDDDDDYSDDFDFSDEDEPQEVEPTEASMQATIDQMTEKLENMVNGLQAGHGNEIPTFDQAAALSEVYTRLSKNRSFQRIIDTVGRLKLNTHFLAAVQVAEPENLVNITTGRNIPQVLPQDMSLLMGNDTEFKLFVQKYNNNELLQYQHTSLTKPGKGPMIVCVDVSTSMDGNKTEWAKTIALAAYLQCVKDKRWFAVVVFSDNATIKTAKTNRSLDPELVEYMVRMGGGGGTNFGAPWYRSTEFLSSKRQSQAWKNSDIVFLTDGDGNFDPNMILKDKKRFSTRLLTFFLGINQADAERNYPDDHHNEWLRGKPLHQRLAEWAKLNDAVAYVESFSEDTEKMAFEMIKSKEQKRGKPVGA